MPSRTQTGDAGHESALAGGVGDPEDQLEPESTMAATVVKNVTRTERYIEEVPAATHLPYAVSRSAVAAPDEPTDDIEAFLRTLTEDEQYILRVDALPEYNATQRFGRGARTVYKGEITFEPATYLRDIQSCFGPGDYRLTLFRQPGHTFKKRWCESVAAPPQPFPAVIGHSATPNSQMTFVPYNAQPPAPPVDPFDSFIATAKRFAEVQRLFNGGQSNARELPAPASGQAASNEANPSDRIFEGLIQLATKNDAIAAKLLAKYLGEPETAEPSLWEGLIEYLKPILPTLIPQLLALLSAQPGFVPGQAPIANLPPPPAPRPARGPMIPPPPGAMAEPPVMPGTHEMPFEVFTPEPIEPEVMGDEGDAPQFALVDRLVEMLNACITANQVIAEHITRGSDEVLAAMASSPEIGGLISMLVNGTPDMVMGMLAMLYPEITVARTNPVAIQAIEALQAILRPNAQPQPLAA